jgi:hypothetical protein
MGKAGTPQFPQQFAVGQVDEQYTLNPPAPGIVPAFGAVGDIVAEASASTASAGATGKIADAAHRHGMPTLQALAAGIVTDIAAETSAAATAAGTVGKYADAGHVHGMPTLQALAAGIVTDIVAETSASTAAAGAVGKYADAGHRHAMPALAAPGGVTTDLSTTAIVGGGGGIIEHFAHGENVAVTLGFTPAKGNLLLIFLAGNGGGNGTWAPAGWTNIFAGDGGYHPNVHAIKRVSDGTETTVALTGTTAIAWSNWVAYELSGVDTTTVVVVGAQGTTNSPATATFGALTPAGPVIGIAFNATGGPNSAGYPGNPGFAATAPWVLDIGTAGPINGGNAPYTMSAHALGNSASTAPVVTEVVHSDGWANVLVYISGLPTQSHARVAAGVPTGAPTTGENGMALDTTAVSGGLYVWSGSAWVKGSVIP